MVSYVLPALLLSWAAITLAIPADYIEVNDEGYYKLHTTSANWVNAWHTCIKEGAQLVVVNSLGEENGIRNIYNQHPTINGGMWIGVHDRFVENVFVTVLGYTLDLAGHTAWNAGEPNNANGGEHCVAFFRNNGKWNDYDCNAALPFMCEWTTTYDIIPV